MKTANNNPVDLLRNDPDFRAAAWNTEKRRFIRGKCSAENSTGTMPVWPVFCRVLFHRDFLLLFYTLQCRLH